MGNRPYITQYDDWRAPIAGEKFDPYVDRYFKTPTTASWSGDTPMITSQGWFPLQPRDRLGNMTRNNPKMRNFPIYTENVSLAVNSRRERSRIAGLLFPGLPLHPPFARPASHRHAFPIGLTDAFPNCFPAPRIKSNHAGVRLAADHHQQ